MPTVLVVEDDSLVRALAVDFLQELGHLTEEAGTASEAMAKLSGAGPIDAVMVDLGLPDRSGDQMVRSLRQLRPELPVVIASGQGEADVRAKFADDPAVGVLGKPYTIETLERALQAIGIVGKA
jgi:CheY-like chemotaxis protein